MENYNHLDTYCPSQGPLPIDQFEFSSQEDTSESRAANGSTSEVHADTSTFEEVPTSSSFETLDMDFLSQTQRNGTENTKDTDALDEDDEHGTPLSQLRGVGAEAERVDDDVQIIDNGTHQSTSHEKGSSVGASAVLMQNARMLNQKQRTEYVANLRRPSRFDHHRCPFFKKIPKTDFIVDGFQWASPRLSRNYFLTHFHADHYVGLNRSFNYGTIYCSITTARLAHKRLGIPWRFFKPLPKNSFVEINHTRVAAIDANHCPGAVMFLFVLPDGCSYLHVGDFRWHEKMKQNELLRQYSRFSTAKFKGLFLDTTYCKPQYNFPLQKESIDAVLELVKKYADDSGVLFVFGSYSIGKERPWIKAAQLLNSPVYVNNRRLESLHCYEELPNEVRQNLTTDPEKSRVHVIPMQQLSLVRLAPMLQRFRKQYQESTNDSSESISTPTYQGNDVTRRVTGIDKFFGGSNSSKKNRRKHKEKNLAAQFAKLRELSADKPLEEASRGNCTLDSASFTSFSANALKSYKSDRYPGFHSMVAFRPTGWIWDAVDTENSGNNPEEGVTEKRSSPLIYVTTSFGTSIPVSVSKRSGGAKLATESNQPNEEDLAPTQMRQTQQQTQALEDTTNVRRKRRRREKQSTGGQSAAIKGGITLYGIPYSEHSSFPELRDCVDFFQPENIIPTVNCQTAEDANNTVHLLRGMHV
eukprot:gb/GECG01015752.1/.p1 GENE.gb/GECG01015752.1/~~gb/GECG01015752.1/.p1  ORF type:complete len:697 (+),score=93.85 gb/GECG01015752.1/:1-2091(+)